MFSQTAVLAEVMRDERALAVSSAGLERRHLAEVLEARRPGQSLAHRLRSAFDRTTATYRTTAICCAAA